MSSVLTPLVLDLLKGVASDDTGVFTVVGACYLDLDNLPFPAVKEILWRVILESSSPAGGDQAVVDLFDTSGVLGAPDTVTDSELDNSGAADQTVPEMFEVDLRQRLVGVASGPGVFEARLKVFDAGGGATVYCKSAQLILVPAFQPPPII